MSTHPDPDETRIRLRAVLDAQFTLLLVVCVVLAAAGGALVYGTYVDPGTETESQEISSWSYDAGYDHSAEVTEPNEVFPVGDVLENRETYFTRIAPDLDVAAELVYAAEQSEDVRIEIESELVIRNVGDGVVYWEETQPLASTTVEDPEPGEPVAAEFTLNSGEIDQRATSIEEDLGASPGRTEAFVSTEMELEGTLNGESITRSPSLEFGIDHAGDTYTVGDPGPESESDTVPQEVTQEVERTYGPLRTIGGPLLLVVGIVAGAGLSYARYEGSLDVSEAERAYLSYRDDRSEFDEWITRIRLPPEAHDRPVAYADSLRDLVDFAIDNETGVIEDPDTGAFHAVTGEFVYTYQRPDAPVQHTDADGPAESAESAESATAGEAVTNDEDGTDDGTVLDMPPSEADGGESEPHSSPDPFDTGPVETAGSDGSPAADGADDDPSTKDGD